MAMRTGSQSAMTLPAMCRRRMLQIGSLGAFGLSSLDVLHINQSSAAETTGQFDGFGKARSCIVLFCWGGMSQLEGWDPKPEAPKQVRGDYKAISTSTPGVNIGEYLPRLAKQTQRLAIVRSVRHRARDHRQAVYWTLTGVPPVVLDGAMVSNPVLATREDKPCLGSMVARMRPTQKGFPGTVTVPYPVAERGLVAGQNGGFLGVKFDPLFVRPKSGKPFRGVSPVSAAPNLNLPDTVGRDRHFTRQSLLKQLDAPLLEGGPTPQMGTYDYFHEFAMEMLSNSQVQRAFDLEREPAKVREKYGDHILGKSVLLARRLTEIGIPLVTVNCGAGDLNGGVGAIWDTHFFNFPQLKKFLMPPFDHAASTLLNDLAERGTLDQTLVLLLTEFGRQPLLNKVAGRDHLPDCYSVAFAGGGQVYGESDRIAATVKDGACGPRDLHATVFHALGIAPGSSISDGSNRVVPLTDGQRLPLF